MHAVHVASTGAYLPGDPLDDDLVESLVGPLPAQVADNLPPGLRHWAIDPATGRHRETNSEMAAKAVAQAVDRAGLAVGDIDLLVVSTASPDHALPPMVTLLQARLGLTRCATIEVRSGCAGAVEGLDVATQYLRSGRFRTAVVVGSEMISPLLAPIFLGRDPRSVRLRDRMVAYTFGDGAGAIVLRAAGPDTHDVAGGGRGVLAGAFASVGGDRPPGMQIDGAGTRDPVAEVLLRARPFELKVDVVESGRHTPFVIAEGLSAVLAAGSVAAGDVDLCVLPEGNAGYVRQEFESAGLDTASWLAVEDRVMENLTTVGATGSAAVPLALDEAWVSGRVRADDLVMLLAIETSKWKYAGSLVRWTAPPVAGTT
jgi:3-oxoacyl-[acyl-carrier-protein] synthase-3